MKPPQLSAVAACCIMVALTAPPAAGQTVRELTAQGISAYEDLEYDLAVERLTQALRETPSVAPDSVRNRILSYLGASEVFRGNLDSAAARFQSLLLRDPGYRLDQLVFPPDVAIVFDAVRLQTRAVRVVVPDETTIRTAADRFTARILAASAHRITVDVRLGSGGRVTTLYDGSIGDSLDVAWNVRRDVTAGSGRADLLAVNSHDASGRIVRRVEIPLAIEVTRPDTLAHPPPPDSAMLLPERAPARPRGEALAAGFVVGLGVLLLPQALASESDLSPGRFVVSAGVSLAGVIALFSPAAGRPLPDNAAANAAMWQSWRDSVVSVVQQNQQRRADVTITVRAGTSNVIDRSER